MYKVNKIPSEIRKFFAENRSAAIMEEFTKLPEKQNIDSRYLGGVKHGNCKLTNKQPSYEFYHQTQLSQNLRQLNILITLLSKYWR